jgi:hypothetical protein
VYSDATSDLVAAEGLVLLDIQQSPRRFKLAVVDFTTAIALRPLWVTLAWNDILHRYRRSALGPLWLTASMAISIIAIANDRVARYLEQYQPELLIEFQKIAEMTSTLPSEAA